MPSSPTEIVAADRRAYFGRALCCDFRGAAHAVHLSSLKQSPASSATSLRSC